MKKENALILVVALISVFLFYKIIIVKVSHKIKSYPRNILAEFYIQEEGVALEDILEEIKVTNEDTKKNLEKKIKTQSNITISNSTTNKEITNNITNIITNNLKNNLKKINLTKEEEFFFDKIFFIEHKYLVDEILTPSLKRYESNYYISFTGKIKAVEDISPIIKVDSNQFFSFTLYNEMGKVIKEKKRLSQQTYSINIYLSLRKDKIYRYRIDYFQKRKPTKLQISHWIDDKKNAKPFGKNNKKLRFIR